MSVLTNDMHKRADKKSVPTSGLGQASERKEQNHEAALKSAFGIPILTTRRN
jgi:hypothetical protein